MTLGEGKRRVLMLLNEYSGGREVTLNDDLSVRMEVSVEVIVTDEHEENGRDVYDEWDGIGFTILGDAVAPAVPNANIRAIAAMQEEFEEMKLRVASLVKEDSKTEKPKKNPEQKAARRPRPPLARQH